MVKGIYAGVFDLLHPGHLFAFELARKHCDILTAALNMDPTVDNPKKNKPIESGGDRRYRLLSCIYVDHVISYTGEKELEALYRCGDYDVAFIADEHRENYTDPTPAKPIFIPKISWHSSTRLRQKIYESSKKTHQNQH